MLVQGGPNIALRRELEDIILLELQKKAEVKKNRLVARSEIDKVRLDQENGELLHGFANRIKL